MEDDFLYFINVNYDNDDYVEEYYLDEDEKELDFEEEDDEQY